MPFMIENYVPTLAIRPSEMRGLEYLPLATKARMTPCVLLAPWSSSRSIGSAIERLEKSFSHGKYFLDIDRDYTMSNPEATAQKELQKISKSEGAFENWCNFVQDYDRVMPCLQLHAQTKDTIQRQIKRFRKNGRTFALRIFRGRTPSNLDEAIAAVSAEGAADFVVILEGGWVGDALTLQAWFSGIVKDSLDSIDAQVPIVASCTTMPKAFSQFSGRSQVHFANRSSVAEVQKRHNFRRIVYGDWASTRPRQRQGGGGVPIPPRIDYPSKDSWWIYRNPDEAWTFQTAAEQLVTDSNVWDGSTGQWGEQMISETAVSEHLGIDTPQKNVAVRVNLHLYRQAYFGAVLPTLEDLEDDWED